jgi:F0F1-type ATP synthase assembly protein I
MDRSMRNDETECREAMRYSWLGVEFAIIVVAFAAGGFWLDQVLETSPGFTALLGVTGLICALYRAIRDGMQFRQWLAEHKRNQDRSESDNGSNSGDAGK